MRRSGVVPSVSRETPCHAGFAGQPSNAPTVGATSVKNLQSNALWLVDLSELG